MLELILDKIVLLLTPLIIFNVVAHDARLEYISEIANAPTGAFSEQIYKAESIILADNSIARPSTKKSVSTSIVANVENPRDTITKPRKEDKEKDNVMQTGISYDVYASA